jgi:hypothetical protein
MRPRVSRHSEPTPGPGRRVYVFCPSFPWFSKARPRVHAAFAALLFLSGGRRRTALPVFVSMAVSSLHVFVSMAVSSLDVHPSLLPLISGAVTLFPWKN